VQLEIRQALRRVFEEARLQFTDGAVRYPLMWDWDNQAL
jgi:hypothetical protein